MAKPELEDGFTPIANEILEKLARMPLAPNQWRVLLCIIRKTYGFHKKVDYIANFQIGEATGLCKAVISRCLKGLSDIQLINRKGKYIGFQKDWEQWGKLATLLTSEPTEDTKKSQKLRIVRADGYIGIWHGAVEPEFQRMATKQGYILEHRLIIARKLGRCLEPWEVVHHKDGMPSHNSEDNLELLPSQTEHMPSILVKQRIKQLEAELAKLQTKVGDKLAESSSTVAIPSTKVSSPAVTQKIKDTITKDNTIPPNKKNYFFDNIRLTEVEYQKLVGQFGEAGTKERLEDLSLYKESKGKKYASDYATILSWERMNKKEGGRDGTHRRSSSQLPQRDSYTKPEDYRARTG